MAYNHAEPSPQHQPYDYRAQPDDMAQRNTSWAPSPTYGPPRPAGDAYYETASSRLPPPSGLMNGMSGSHPRPMPQEHQPPYHRPEYHHHHEYQQPPSPTYHQAPPQYQHYAPPALSNDPYRAPMPQPQYSSYEPPREPQRAPPPPAGDFDPYQEAREQHMMSRNLPPQMPEAPRVPNSNYDGKVAIPFTPQSLRIPAVRSGSTVPPAGAPWSATSQPDRSVKIEHLLSGGASQAVQHIIDQKPAPPKNEYAIYFRQQPVAARCCGYGERDRRVIDPPPIVQLRINNPDLTPDEMYQRIHHPAYVVHCSIWCKDGVKDETDMPSDYVRPGKRLMGSLVSSPFVGQDENGEEGCFFCFPDMSVRTPGPFRLRFALIVVDPMHRSPKAPIKSTIMSDVFQVYNAKDFPGMQASTPLTKRLKEQGCLISIKKGNEKSGGKSRRQDDSDEDDEEGGSSNKRKKSKKQR
ncbi:Sexual development regulator VELC [Colletotrichum aenigma]|uniref:Sexual development regulator VELC n=1 Tax=Colletotrichum aenigma TaxID=1215731 RepID=UPI001872DEA2|nr:Sexual development regulator VELC [Colletotrichum aenigma]KAF5521521.1 Sexual development regulator VELC [Colletotrichum aenigma]